MRYRKKRYFSRGALTILAAVLACMFLMPTLLTITNSFMTQSEITANYGQVFQNAANGTSYIKDTINLKFIPDKVSFSQYFTVLLKSPDFLYKFWNSVILVVPIVLAQLLVASIAAYGFTRWRGKVRDSIFFFYVILMLMPYQVTLVPNYLVSDWLGILDTRWAIILPGAFAPFSVFLLTKFMRRIPASLIEAAKLDGAGEWRIFWNICLPQCRSALYSIAILVFIGHWNDLNGPLLYLQNGSKYTLSIGLQIFLTDANQEWNLLMAASVLFTVPLIVIFFIAQKQFISGISTTSGLK